MISVTSIRLPQVASSVPGAMSLVVATGLVGVLSVGRFYDARLGMVSYLISSLFLIALAVVFSSNTFHFGRFSKLFLAYLTVLLGLSLVHITLGVTPSSSLPYAAEKVVTLAFITLPLVLVVGAVSSDALLKAFYHLWGSVGITIALMGAFIAVISGGDTARMSILGGGPIVFARWACVGILYLIFFNRSAILIRLPLIIFCSLAVLSSGSKGPVVSLVLTTIFAFVLYGIKGRKTKRNLWHPAILALVVIMTFFAMPETPSRQRIIQVGSASELRELSSFQIRLNLWAYSRKAVMEHPDGIGIANYSNMMSEYGLKVPDNYYPHNISMEIAVEYGAILAICLLLFFVASLKRIMTFPAKYDRPYFLGGLLFIFYLLNSHVSGDLSDARFLFVNMALIFRQDHK